LKEAVRESSIFYRPLFDIVRFLSLCIVAVCAAEYMVELDVK
jgi:hypothetical protein